MIKLVIKKEKIFRFVPTPNDLTATVGTAYLSTSGLALNMVIDPQLHTVPLRSLIPVLNGNRRKAALFVPEEDVAPDPQQA